MTTQNTGVGLTTNTFTNATGSSEKGTTLTRLSASHDALKVVVSDLSASHYDLSANHDALKSTVSDLSASHYDLSANHDALKSTVSDLSASHYDLSANHRALKSTVSDLSASHYDLSANHRALKTLVTDLSASHYDLSRNHVALKSTVTDLSASHYDLSANHRALKSTVSDLSASHYDLSANHRALKSTVSDLSASHYDLSRNHVALKSTVSDLSASHYDLSRNHVALKSTVTDLSASHYDLSRNHVALKSTVTDLSASHYDLSRNHVALKSTVSDLSASHYDLSANHRALKSTVTDLSASHYDLSRNHLTLKNTVTDLSASHYDLSRNHSALKSTVSDLSASHNDLSRNHLTLKNTVNDLSASHYDLSGNHRALKTLVTDLSTNNNIRFNNIDTSLSQVYTKTQSDSIFVSKSNIDLSNLSTNIIPSTDNTYKIGDISKNWRNAYIKDISVTNIDIANNLNVLGPTQLKNTLNVADNVTLKGSTLYAPESFYIDPYAHGVNTGTVFINGNLTVLGLTTTINSTTIDISDKTILLASNASNPNEANGAGIEISGANVNFIYEYDNLTSAFRSSIGLSISGNVVPATGTIVNLGQSDNRWKIAYIDELNVNSFTYSINGANITNETITSTQIMNNTIVDDDISANASIAFSKINTTNAITNSDISANASIAFSKINTTNAIVNSDISANASIAFSKINTTNAIVNSDISNNAAIAFSKINTTNAITNSDISNNASIAFSKINTTNAIVNSDISNNAAIAFSKINTTNAITNSDISNNASIAFSKINTTNAIVNSDISNNAAIAFSKINTTNAIVNSDISTNAAIAFSKINTTNAIVNSDISASASIAFSKINTTNAIVNSDISNNASIAFSKINTTNAIMDSDISTNAAIQGSKIASETITSTQIMNNTIVDGDISNNAAIAFSKINATNAIVDDDISANANILGSKLAINSITSDKINQSNNWTFSQLTSNTANIRDISTTNISVSGSIIPLDTSSSDLGSLTKRFNKIFTNDLSVNTINGQAYNATTAIDLTSVSGNIIPSLNNTFRLGDTSRNWNNAYIKDISATNISVSGDIIPSITFGVNTRGTGGTITICGEYVIHTFTTNGIFKPVSNRPVEVLLVGGGGGGGMGYPNLGGGGGGGGGVIYIPAALVNSMVEYSVVVGNGGEAFNNGGNTSVFGAIAAGGGGGGGYANGTNGLSGGSGGGAQAPEELPLTTGGASINSSLGPNSGIIYGNSGGSCTTVSNTSATAAQLGAGGGGAGASGATTNSNILTTSQTGNGSGGIGVMNNILGPNYYWGGGGGGGSNNGHGGWGGIGGGGGGRSYFGQSGPGGGSALNPPSSHGGTNTGGGGGGSNWRLGLPGLGGSGIVIIRYAQVSGSSLGTFFNPWSLSYMYDINAININVTSNLNPLFASTGNLGNSSKPWGNSNINNLSVGSINVTNSVNPLTTLTGSIGTTAKPWGNANICDISASNIDISGNILPLRDISSDLGSLTKRWRNIYVNDLSVTTINGQAYSATPAIDLTSVSGNIIPSSNNNFRLGDTSRNWSNAYIRDISATNISISGNILLNIGGGNIRNINQLSADTSNNIITTRNRIYQNISTTINDICWNSVNGYYGLAKDAYPALNPYSSGTAAFSNMTIRTLPSDISKNDYWNSICWSPELRLFVAVSSSSGVPNKNIMTSNDGITWSPQSSVNGYALNAVAWSPKLGMFVALGSIDYGTGISGSLYSYNGYNWNPVITKMRGTGAICWSPELEMFTACTDIGGTFYSYNGITWSSNTGVTANSMCWSPELKLFVGAGYSMIYSSDGINWSTSSSGFGFTGEYYYGVCWSPQVGKFVAVSGPYPIIYSYNGKDWIVAVSGVSGGGGSQRDLKSVIWSAQLGLFIAAGTNGRGAKILYSIDGINWTEKFFDNFTCRRICWSPELGILVSVGNTSYNVNYPGDSIVFTSSLKARPPTSYNVFDSSFNSIDETGKWTFSAIDISTNLNPSTPLTGFVGTTAKPWGNAVIRDLSVSTINGQAYSATPAIDLTSVSGNIIPSLNNTFRLGDVSRNWSNAYIRDISATNISISGNIIFSISGGSMRIAADASTSSITSTHRIYQNISGGINDLSWSSVNGYYALAKDAYPALNPLSSGEEAVKTWIGRVSANETNSWRSICWSPQLRIFVAVAGTGTNRVMTSPDGITWTRRLSSNESHNWSSVCWSPELRLFVAVSFSGWADQAMTSSDGITWTTRVTAPGGWWSVCWSPERGLFVAVARSNTRVMTSPNGITWTARTSANETNVWYSVCWSPQLGIFVAVAQYGFSSTETDRIMTSPDGISWSKSTSTIGGNSVCWSEELGLFVAVHDYGTTNILTSPNGQTWTITAYNAVGSFVSVCWSKQLRLFVAVVYLGSSNNNKVITSPNGTTWTGRLSADIDGTTGWASICWSPELGIFAAVAETGTNRVMTSSLKARPPTSYNVFDSSFNSIDQSGNWTFQNITTNSRIYQNISGGINDLSWAAVNGYYGLAKDAYPALNPLSSGAKALQTWTNRNITGRWNSICWSPKLGLFLAINTTTYGSLLQSNYITSKDGINWSVGSFVARTFAGTTNPGIASICWSPELEIFVGYSTTDTSSVIYSTNGTSWNYSNINISIAVDIYTLCWSPELRIFLAAHKVPSLGIFSSKDGITWNSVNPSFTPSMSSQIITRSICWSSELGLFVGVGSYGTWRVITSNNGTNWNLIDIGTANSFYSVCWSKELGLFVAVGNSNTFRVAISNNGRQWTLVNIGTTYALFTVTWAPQLGLFVAGSNNNTILTSSYGIKWNVNNSSGDFLSSCWSPELGIHVAVGNDTIVTSSLKARPPTSTNVFDSSFNSIDETGNWTFQNIDISTNLNPSIPDSGNLGLSNKRWANAFVNDLSVTRINGFVYSATPAIDLTSVSGNIIPSSDIQFKLGDVSRNWSNAYIRDISATNISISGNLILNISGSMTDITDTFNNLGSTFDTIETSIYNIEQNVIDLSNNKAPLANPTFTGTVGGITKSMVGLSNVDNTTDLLKPISNATQSALDLKANLASPNFTGTVGGITKTMVGLSNVDNTSDANKPVSTATLAALNLKANLVSPTFTGTVVLPANTINSSHIVDGTILGTDISNKTITATQIADSTITKFQIAPNTITSANIASGTITSAEIAVGAITSSNILDGTILGEDINGSSLVSRVLTNSYFTENIGTTIPGPTTGSYFGQYIELSGDGRTLAAWRAPSGNGGAIIYRLNSNNQWIQLGSTLFVNSGTNGALALSNDGNTFALGVVNAGNGSVQIYNLNTTNNTWTIVATLTGASSGDWFGSGLSFDLNATTLAIGIAQGDEGATLNVGKVDIYKFLSPWTYATSIPATSGVITADRKGMAVSLSGSGTRIVIGSDWADSGGSNDIGLIQIYDNTTGNTWTLMASFYGTIGIGTNYFGNVVKISQDGNTVIAGAYQASSGNGYARVYRLNNNSWTLLGSQIYTSPDASTGFSVAINADGTIIVVGAPGSNSFSGTLRVYKFNGTNWVEIIPSINGVTSAKLGSGCAINPAGNVLAYSSPNVNTQTGEVKVLKLDSYLRSTLIEDSSITATTLSSRITNLELTAVTRSYDKILNGVASVIIPVDLLNNDSVEIRASFRFRGTYNPNSRLYAEYYDDYNNILQQFNGTVINIVSQEGAQNEIYASASTVDFRAMLMYAMNTDDYYGNTNSLVFKLIKPVNDLADPKTWSYTGESEWSGGVRRRGELMGQYYYRPRSVAFWVNSGTFDVIYSIVNDKRVTANNIDSIPAGISADSALSIENRLKALEDNALISSTDTIISGTTGNQIVIPIDLVNNESVTINFTFQLPGAYNGDEVYISYRTNGVGYNFEEARATTIVHNGNTYVKTGGAITQSIEAQNLSNVFTIKVYRSFTTNTPSQRYLMEGEGAYCVAGQGNARVEFNGHTNARIPNEIFITHGSTYSMSARYSVINNKDSTVISSVSSLASVGSITRNFISSSTNASTIQIPLDFTTYKSVEVEITFTFFGTIWGSRLWAIYKSSDNTYRNFFYHNLTTLSGVINAPWIREDWGSSAYRGMCMFDMATNLDGDGYWSSGNLKMRIHRGNNLRPDPKVYFISGETNYSRSGYGTASGIINASTDWRPIELYFYTTAGTTFNAEWYITGYK